MMSQRISNQLCGWEQRMVVSMSTIALTTFGLRRTRLRYSILVPCIPFSIWIIVYLCRWLMGIYVFTHEIIVRDGFPFNCNNKVIMLITNYSI